jgi:hypothetical protein
MGHNTPSQSPSPLPRFVWPRPGSDQPRLAWPEFLRVVALQLQRDYPCPGPSADPGASLGNFLAAHLIALSEQATALQAWDPASHVARAQEAEDINAAWQMALEAEIENPGIWVITTPDESPDGAQRGYFSRDMDDETYIN